MSSSVSVTNSSSNSTHNYIKAIYFIVSYAVVSVLNDVLMRCIAESVSVSQVLVMRFGIGALMLYGVVRWQRIKLITPAFKVHLCSGIVLFIAMRLYVNSLGVLPLAINNLGLFAIPIIVTVIARVLLGEKSSLLYILIGFSGVLVAIGGSLHGNFAYLISAVVLFACLDIINKILITKQEALSVIMFYVAFCAFCFGVICQVVSGGIMEFNYGLSGVQIMQIILVAIGGNLVLWLLLKGFSYAPISHVQPVKLVELPISFMMGYVIFGETVGVYQYVGSVLIVMPVFMQLYKSLTCKKCE